MDRHVIQIGSTATGKADSTLALDGDDVGSAATLEYR
jgi:hypothetical protein